jgi:hypothetical protein
MVYALEHDLNRAQQLDAIAIANRRVLQEIRENKANAENFLRTPENNDL